MPAKNVTVAFAERRVETQTFEPLGRHGVPLEGFHKLVCIDAMDFKIVPLREGSHANRTLQFGQSHEVSVGGFVRRRSGIPSRKDKGMHKNHIRLPSRTETSRHQTEEIHELLFVHLLSPDIAPPTPNFAVGGVGYGLGKRFSSWWKGRLRRDGPAIRASGRRW